MFLAEIRRDDTWAPLARVSVAGSDDRTRTGVEVEIDRAATTLLPRLVYLKRTKAGLTAERVELPHAPTSGIPFALKWEPNRVRVSIDHWEHWSDLPLPFVPERLLLECSTADAFFYSVNVESAAPPTNSGAEP